MPDYYKLRILGQIRIETFLKVRPDNSASKINGIMMFHYIHLTAISISSDEMNS